MRFNGKRFLWLISAIFSFLLGGSFLASFGWYKDYQKIPGDLLIGNRTANVDRLKGDGSSFSFLVIGDIHNSRTGEILIKSGLELGRPSFVIILGDIVSKPALWDHRFFLTEMVHEVKPTVPVFLVLIRK